MTVRFFSSVTYSDTAPVYQMTLLWYEATDGDYFCLRCNRALYYVFVVVCFLLSYAFLVTIGSQLNEDYFSVHCTLHLYYMFVNVCFFCCQMHF